MPCPLFVSAARPAALGILLTFAFVGGGCGRSEERVVRASWPQPTPDRTVDAVVRGLVTVVPLDATPTPEPTLAVAATRQTASNSARPPSAAPSRTRSPSTP